MPTLSVLMPARNAAATVRQAVVSTLRHLPRDAELVVLDDGSTDGTGARLEDVGDPRLRVLRGAGSGGVAQALTRLLASTDSELVGRMDADDVSLPGRFTHGLAALGRGMDFVFTSALTQTSWRVRPSLPLPISPEAFPFHLLLSNPVRHPSMLARRRALESLGGYRPVPSEDYDLWLRAASSGMALCKIPWYGITYRVHPAQVSSDSAWRDRSRGDALVMEEFRELSERLLGTAYPRLVSLEHLDTEESRPVLDDFGANLLRATSRLSPTSRLYLRLKLHRRRSEVLAAGRSSSAEGVGRGQ